MQSVLKFFGTKSTVFQFPSFDKDDLKDADIQRFLKVCRNSTDIAPNKFGVRSTKVNFTFGRVIVEFSKNSGLFALTQCVIYVANYKYELGDGKEEVRVKLVIAPPVEDEDDEEIIDLSFLGEKPQSASDDDDDDDDDVLDLA